MTHEKICGCFRCDPPIIKKDPIWSKWKPEYITYTVLLITTLGSFLIETYFKIKKENKNG